MPGSHAEQRCTALRHSLPLSLLCVLASVKSFLPSSALHDSCCFILTDEETGHRGSVWPSRHHKAGSDPPVKERELEKCL